MRNCLAFTGRKTLNNEIECFSYFPSRALGAGLQSTGTKGDKWGDMKIGLIDVDSSNFPNLPLMKISSWHKAAGDSVEWYEPFKALSEGEYDKIYIAKVFSFTPDYKYPLYAKEVVRGGSGYAINLVGGREIYDKSRDESLPAEIEHAYPDYSLYGITDTAYGFLTRGCPRGCNFCHVKTKEGLRSRKVADLNEFWRGQKNICLSDPNLFACKEKLQLLQQLVDSKAWVDFNQGVDVRLLTPDVLELMKRIKLKRVHFAYDRWQDKEIIEPKIKAFRENIGHHRSQLVCFVLVNFDTTLEQDLHRIYFLRDLDIQPYVMIYDGAHASKTYKNLRRWCNSPIIFWGTPKFEDYEPNHKKENLQSERLF